MQIFIAEEVFCSSLKKGDAFVAHKSLQELYERRNVFYEGLTLLHFYEFIKRHAPIYAPFTSEMLERIPKYDFISEYISSFANFVFVDTNKDGELYINYLGTGDVYTLLSEEVLDDEDDGLCYDKKIEDEYDDIIRTEDIVDSEEIEARNAVDVSNEIVECYMECEATKILNEAEIKAYEQKILQWEAVAEFTKHQKGEPYFKAIAEIDYMKEMIEISKFSCEELSLTMDECKDDLLEVWKEVFYKQ